MIDMNSFYSFDKRLLAAGLRARAQEKQKGIRQISRETWLAPNTVCRCLNGESDYFPTARTLYVLCKYLGASMDELMDKAATWHGGGEKA